MKNIEFEELVDEIKNLPLEDKEEIKTLVEKYIIEERREDILNNYKKSRKEGLNKKPGYSDNVEELKKQL
jgi:hypothetical protein